MMSTDPSSSAPEEQLGGPAPAQTGQGQQPTSSADPQPPTMNWEPVRKRLLGADLDDALAAALELRDNIEIVHTAEFPLMLSALLPAFSSVLAHRTRPNPDLSSTEHKLRYVVLEIIVKMPTNEILRPHAPHLVAVAMDVLHRDYETNAMVGSKILFDLYKCYRSLPPDSVQPFLDFVIASYRALPGSVQRNFEPEALLAAVQNTETRAQSPAACSGEKQKDDSKEEEEEGEKKESSTKKDPTKADDEKELEDPKTEAVGTEADAEAPRMTVSEGQDQPGSSPPTSEPLQVHESSSQAPEVPSGSTQVAASTSSQGTGTSSATPQATPALYGLSLKSSGSFLVLTECPLSVMLMFQLYPKFMKNNIPVLIQVMMEALAIRPPAFEIVLAKYTGGTGTCEETSEETESGRQSSSPSASKKHRTTLLRRTYFSRMGELVAAQAKTLSFLTYLLRTFAAELKPYEDRLASNVVALMTNCPRESMGTRKELLVATRHLLNSDFRRGFTRHVDTLLADERVLMGSHHRWSDQTLLRPLGYTTLSDLVQHVRGQLSQQQLSKVCSLFSRVLHDEAQPLPLSTQYTAVRTLLGIVDLIFHNKQESDAQLGRDMLVRLLLTLVDKLEALNASFPAIFRAEAGREEQKRRRNAATRPVDVKDIEAQEESVNEGPPEQVSAVLLATAQPDSVKDVQSMIRAIVVGCKSVIYYICNYRKQREKEKAASSGGEKRENTFLPPPGSNEEVSSAMLNMTNTEIELVDRYILTAFPAIKLLIKTPTDEGSAPDDRSNALSGTGEKTLQEQYRDALTYFAATFTVMDGHNLRRSLGKRLDLLVDTIIDDPMVMVVPRHLLASNPTTSYEFCSTLLDYLMKHMDLLAGPPPRCASQKGGSNTVIFFSDDPNRETSAKDYIQEQLNKVSQLPAESDEMKTRRSSTLLHLFERVLKSLSTYANNEAVLRRYLRRIVIISLRSSMENVSVWPDSYCMLLRYVFRSISAGKFEESYKELLPLIPTVLNGLYRVVSASEDSVLRCTAIELCLTIPARLSSLLPHMNLLLRVIVPALESDSGDLVNLGLRTLEFWVDNLNQTFLYPEMLKQTELFCSLMQALSCHLRPAPYPYGLLTLRLLGKLGGKNRQFLREPMRLPPTEEKTGEPSLSIKCSWRSDESDDTDSSALTLPLPIDRALEVLKMVAQDEQLAEKTSERSDTSASCSSTGTIVHWENNSNLWDCRIEDLNVEAYSKEVIEETQHRQATASLAVMRSAVKMTLCDNVHKNSLPGNEQKQVCMALMYASMINSIRAEAWDLLKDMSDRFEQKNIFDSLCLFISDPSESTTCVGLEYLNFLLESKKRGTTSMSFDVFVRVLCEACCSNCWGRSSGLQEAICVLIEVLGREWSRKHEVRLINAALLPIKTVPRELSCAAVTAVRFFIRVCTGLYGNEFCGATVSNEVVWDVLCFDGLPEERNSADGPPDERINLGDSSKGSDEGTVLQPEANARPCEEVFKITLYEIASPQQLVRFAARFLLVHYFLGPSGKDSASSVLSAHLSLVRRILFSRSLRLLPLPQQVGVVEGLSVLISQFPGILPSILPFSDTHVLAFLSELLKMLSVADGEMSDRNLEEFVVDRDGYAGAKTDSITSQYPTHSSSLFFRRECVIEVDRPRMKVAIPGEVPVGVQLRVSAIVLYHSVVRAYSDPFFDAETSSPIGNIRPHIISLFFRSLVSNPLKAVDAAHTALCDVLALGVVAKKSQEEEGSNSQSRLPKELLQTCIRPVLLHLREYTQLSVPLLRGLSRLLSLLSSWFNKTLGEKMLDHLQKWTDPRRIISHKIWREGEEPLVAAAIIGIFADLPDASHFVEPLVKTCIKLEATLPAYKARFVESPYRRPLARYLNKHPGFSVNFFFPRLKTPMYSEFFQSLVQLEQSRGLRDYLFNKQCSQKILNICFERPLAIIRSEKSSSTGGSARSTLFLHGIVQPPSGDSTTDNLKPMNVESLELQYQGVRLVKILSMNNPTYFHDNSDTVRAFRLLWRSKGRFLRLQNEHAISPRFHEETKMLASFLISCAYVKSLPDEYLDIVFELIRVFLQPPTTDISFITRFLTEMVTNVLSVGQKKKLVQRFFALVAGKSSEETKVFTIQFLVFPMLSSVARAESCGKVRGQNMTTQKQIESADEVSDTDVTESKTSVIDQALIEKFLKEILLPEGNPISGGDRLKVELLRLLNLFVEYHPRYVEPSRMEMVKFCLGLLKSNDTACKSWAYVVVCRFISAFEMPVEIVVQVYVALLRCHQPEGKELVRAALDLLVPALPVRLSGEDFKKMLEQTSQMMIEDGNSTPQLAHIEMTVARNPEVFQSHRAQFLAYMVTSLNRLGLPPNCPLENRVLAVDMVLLLLDWDASDEEPNKVMITNDQADSIGNFLIRLRILMAEPPDARTGKGDQGTFALGERAGEVFHRVISKWDVNVRATPFEKARDAKSTGQLCACLELMSSMIKYGRRGFFSGNYPLINDIVVSCFGHAREDPSLRREVRTFVWEAKEISSLLSLNVVSLENIINEGLTVQRKVASSGRSSDASRSSASRRDRSVGGDEGLVVSAHMLFAIELLAELCRYRKATLKAVAASLLSLAGTLSKNHIMDAAAKQRQGSSHAPRASLSGVRHHTPTIGIIEEAHQRHQADSSKPTPGKNRPSRENGILGSDLRGLVIVLGIFEECEVIYHFTQSRKTLYQIVSSILDTSDNVQVLMIAVRIIGKWILPDGSGCPLTAKEKNSLLWKVAAFDFSSLSDDIVAQPLADLIACFVKDLNKQKQKKKENDHGKLIVACLLNANERAREDMQRIYLESGSAGKTSTRSSKMVATELLWCLLHSDFEGLGGRLWTTVFVDILLRLVVSEDSECVDACRVLAHGDVPLCLTLFERLLTAAWNEIPHDGMRMKIIASIEALFSRAFHSQFLRSRFNHGDSRCLNSVRAFLNGLSVLTPTPVLDTRLLVSIAESYNSWHEVLSLFERQYHALRNEPCAMVMLSAMRHCYRQLGEEDMWLSLAHESCVLRSSSRAVSLDVYDKAEEAAGQYADLIELVEAPGIKLDPSDFEMNLWEERWIVLQKELCQQDVVSEFANESGNPRLQLECAWKSQNWSMVRNLCSSTPLLASMESGDPIVKMSETLLAVADGNLTDVENLHAQTAQLCLYRWQLLPRLSSGSMSHASLLHFFHRLVEIRESGQIMVETGNHSSGRTLPDLKNLLNAWRHRLPNDWEKLSMWDEVFAWRTHMFSAITSNFAWSDPNTLATLHDRPWTSIRMSKTARKQRMRDVALLLLNKAQEERAMNVSDAFLKLREQILAYFNPSSDLERHGGLNLINTTNLSFFDPSQKSELFRLKAMFLASLGGRSKANQAYCHSLQICPSHARAWDSWGELCSSLGAVAEKQAMEQCGTSRNGDETSKEQKLAAAKKVSQYLAQAMGCYLEAIQIDGHEWARMRIPKCLWMLQKDGPSPGVLCQTLENRGSHLPPWVFLPWIPQLLTSLYRREGRAVKSIFTRLVKMYPQAVYYPLRAYYLERRDVERVKGSSSSSSSAQHHGSVSYAEELMSLLRRSHASLWSSLEAVLEELIVKFRPTYDEELLSTIIALLERAETQVGNISKKDEESIVASVWKTLGKIAVKFFRAVDPKSLKQDARARKTAQFKEVFKESFEADFDVSATETEPGSPSPETKALRLEELLGKLRRWKLKLEDFVLSTPDELSLVETSHSLAMFGVSDAPDLWPRACDPYYASSQTYDRETTFDTDTGTTQSSTSSSAAAARKAATAAADAAASAAKREGVGGDYGGGSSWIEVPGQYVPTASTFTDVRPSPELHAKVLKFESSVEVLKRNDQLVRRIGMIASDGKIYRFLLQFAVPYFTRTDERSSQTHFVLDKILRKVFVTSRAHLSVQSHSVVPVAQRLRLISEPDGRTSLDEVYRNNCTRNGIDHTVLGKRYNEEIKKLLEEKSSSSLGDDERRAAEKAVRREAYSKICSAEEADDMILANHLLSILKGPEPLYHFRRVFTQQWAANCLLQYAFSAAERTPSRVVFLESDGRVLSSEFRIAYGSQGYIENPQALPFRLTPNIHSLIGFPLLDARFIASIAKIASAVYECRDVMDPVLRLLMRDDIVAFYTKAMAKSDSKTIEMERQLVDRVSRNVTSIHARFSQCGIKRSDKKEEPVDQNVRDLVDAARSKDNLCMMSSSYQAWL